MNGWIIYPNASILRFILTSQPSLKLCRYIPPRIGCSIASPLRADAHRRHFTLARIFLIHPSTLYLIKFSVDRLEPESGNCRGALHHDQQNAISLGSRTRMLGLRWHLGAYRIEEWGWEEKMPNVQPQPSRGGNCPESSLARSEVALWRPPHALPAAAERPPTRPGRPGRGRTGLPLPII